MGALCVPFVQDDVVGGSTLSQIRSVLVLLFLLLSSSLSSSLIPPPSPSLLADGRGVPTSSILEPVNSDDPNVLVIATMMCFGMFLCSRSCRAPAGDDANDGRDRKRS